MAMKKDTVLENDETVKSSNLHDLHQEEVTSSQVLLFSQSGNLIRSQASWYIETFVHEIYWFLHVKIT